MEGLIRLLKENGKTVVSMRELYEFLEIKKDFTDWCKRMYGYGFIEGQDFSPIWGRSEKGRSMLDYALTLDCAKEISMLQRTQKGKEARMYFIECEKQLMCAESKSEIYFLNIYLKHARNDIAYLKDKIQYLNEVLESKTLIATTVISKELGMSATRLNKILNEFGVQYQWGKSKQWVLSYRFQDLELTRTITHRYNDKNGLPKTYHTTGWSERGREFIHIFMAKTTEDDKLDYLQYIESDKNAKIALRKRTA